MRGTVDEQQYQFILRELKPLGFDDVDKRIDAQIDMKFPKEDKPKD